MGEEQPLFTVANHHMVTTAEPPNVTDDEPNQYRGYFENASGDQSIFLYDRITSEGTLFVGDAGWKRFTVVNGNVEGLVLRPGELAWLRSCWQAATSSSS